MDVTIAMATTLGRWRGKVSQSQFSRFHSSAIFRASSSLRCLRSSKFFADYCDGQLGRIPFGWMKFALKQLRHETRRLIPPNGKMIAGPREQFSFLFPVVAPAAAARVDPKIEEIVLLEHESLRSGAGRVGGEGTAERVFRVAKDTNAQKQGIEKSELQFRLNARIVSGQCCGWLLIARAAY